MYRLQNAFLSCTTVKKKIHREDLSSWYFSRRPLPSSQRWVGKGHQSEKVTDYTMVNATANTLYAIFRQRTHLNHHSSYLWAWKVFCIKAQHYLQLDIKSMKITMSKYYYLTLIFFYVVVTCSMRQFLVPWRVSEAVHGRNSGTTDSLTLGAQDW